MYVVIAELDAGHHATRVSGDDIGVGLAERSREINLVDDHVARIRISRSHDPLRAPEPAKRRSGAWRSIRRVAREASLRLKEHVTALRIRGGRASRGEERAEEK